jgi:poly-gamma-glutamate capsule biosynthesis protein CapA/YwtB (metallophosphatase superfamily)
MLLKNMLKDSQLGGLFFTVMLVFGQLPLAAQQQQLVSIIGTGDMMLGTNYPSKSYLPPNGGNDLLSDVEAILKNADVTFGNLEGTLFDGEGTPKRCRDMSKCYAFRQPASYAGHFTDAGYDVVSMANNHSGDFGPAGRKGTKAVLKNAAIAYAGLAGTDETAVFERNGDKFGFAAFAPNSGTCDIRNLTKAKEIVAALAKQCDIVIVSFHGGAEGSDHQHVPKKTEYYLGENRGDVHAFAHAVIDAGADVVFGHGPHVTRAVELYKDRFIAYSLGNFCTYGRFSLSGATAIAPIIKVFTDEQGAFAKGEITATYQQKIHGPKIDPQKRVIAKIRELTTADFPNSGLVISEDGKIGKSF